MIFKKKVVFIFLLVLLFATSFSKAHAAANLTISSATLNSSGKTITVNIAGVSGSLTPSTGITGFNVRTTSGGGIYPISSVTSSGSIVTITLGAFIGPAETVVVDASSASNLADGGGNTLQDTNGAAVTNSSALSVSVYGVNNSAIIIYGRMDDYGDYYHYHGASTELVFVVNGTDATARVNAGINGFAISVDGGAFTPTPLVAADTDVVVPLFSNLSAGDHVVSLKQYNSNVYARAVKFLQVAGGTGAIRAPGANDGIGYGPYALMGGGNNFLDPGSYTTSGDGFYANPPTYFNTGRRFPDATLRVRGKGTSMKIWVYMGGTSYAWYIDGVKQTNFSVPNTDTWGFYTVSTSLDSSNEHIYTIQGVKNSPTYVDAVMFSGSNAAFSSSSLPTIQGIGAFGDSITVANAGTGNDSSVGYLSSLAMSQGYIPYNRGVDGSAVQGDGENRTSDVTGISPELKETFILYGTNEIGGNTTPTSGFSTAYQSMLNQLLSGTTNEKFYAIGILPRNGVSDSVIAAWNGAGNGIKGSVDAVKAATPAYASRLYFVDSSSWKMNGANSTDYTTNFADGLHPNATGYGVMTSFLLPYAASSSAYTISGPTSGISGNASTNFTVSVIAGGKFDGTSTITISDGGNGGTFTPAIGSASSSSISIVPTASSTSFTFTYTPATSGSKTLSFANAQGWTNPSSVSYSAASADVTPPVISAISSSPTQTATTITWTTNEAASSTVIYGLTTSYGLASSSQAFVTSHSIRISGLTASTLYHFKVAGSDANGNVSTSTDQTFTTSAVPDTTAPVISGIATSTTDTSASISFTTNEAATSTIQFGPTTSYGSTVIVSPAVTSHSASFSSLSASTTYHYKITVVDASGNIATTTDTTLTTAQAPVVPTTPTTTPTTHSGSTRSSTRHEVINGVVQTSPVITTTTTTSTTYTSAGCVPGYMFSPTTGEKCAPVTTSASPTLSPYQFTQNLGAGSVGEKVRQLQMYLNTHGYSVSSAGAGSLGYETTTFGALTQAALARFQLAHNISPSYGYFGIITRTYVNQNE